MQIFWISIAGVIGVLSRYFLGIFLTHRLGALFPYATVLINILGSFVIGVVYVLGFGQGLAAARPAVIQETTRLALMVGLLGGFTTFSSFALETYALALSGRWPLAILNVSGSVVFGLAAVGMGIFVGQWVLKFF